MKTLDEIFFPHEIALRAIFGNHKVNSAQEALHLIVATHNKLTRDQQQILGEGLATLERARRVRASHDRRPPEASVTTEARDSLADEMLAQWLVADLAQPYARAGKDSVVGAAMGGPEAARYAQSYIPLTMDARGYLWGEEDFDLINQQRQEELAALDDEEIGRIMNEHKEMIAVLYSNPDIAQYYPCSSTFEDSKEVYPLEEALKDRDEKHKQLWSEIHELRSKNARRRPED
jgi:hypothetical protein